VNTRNNILRKLVNSKSGADANTLRTSAIALSYSAAEYVCQVWKASAHVKNIDIALNESYRIIIGCFRPTEVHKLHTLSGIATPDIRRKTITEIERYKCNQDLRHPLYGYVAAVKHLKSRQSFMHSIKRDCLITKQERQNMWKERLI